MHMTKRVAPPTSFDTDLPLTCCVRSCDRLAVYKLVGSAPTRQNDGGRKRWWYRIDVALTVCADHRDKRYGLVLFRSQTLRRRICDAVRDNQGELPNLAAVKISFVPFASGSA